VLMGTRLWAEEGAPPVLGRDSRVGDGVTRPRGPGRSGPRAAV
jgi:hypothetical protein